MGESNDQSIDRRTFLKTAAATGAAAATTAPMADAAAQPATQLAQGLANPAATAAQAVSAEEGIITRPGSDFMVDVIKTLGIDYVASNPASSFRSLHESLINYGGNRKPEWLTALHEESSVAMAHGYAKAAGKPMAAMVHSTVGLQHASMALYNAWCDRVPVILFAGNTMNAATRKPGTEWNHAAQDPAAMVRDFTRFDDQPASLQQFAESTVRAYKLALTPPMAPVVVTIDSDLQENRIHNAELLSIPKLSHSAPPHADPDALKDAAKLLVGAERPLIVADRMARSQAGIDRLVELAEVLNAPVIDTGSRTNFPTTHQFNLSDGRGSLVDQADVILLLEVNNAWGLLQSIAEKNREVAIRNARKDVKLIHITLNDFLMKSNYQDMQRYQAVDLAISGDAEASLPALTEAIRRELTGERKSAMAARGENLRKQHQEMRERAKTAASYGWSARPVTSARLAAEVWQAVKSEPWSLVVSDRINWPRRLWPAHAYHHFLGGSGGQGIGYSAPGAIGAALANRDKGLFSVTIQPDGDLLFAPGVLWTAAHHRIPLLIVMFNNRAYGQEVMHVGRMAAAHGRPVEAIRNGTQFFDPYPDFAKIAQGHGVWAEGPIEDPDAIAPALTRAVAVVKSGAPALVDVVCQIR